MKNIIMFCKEERDDAADAGLENCTGGNIAARQSGKFSAAHFRECKKRQWVKPVDNVIPSGIRIVFFKHFSIIISIPADFFLPGVRPESADLTHCPKKNFCIPPEEFRSAETVLWHQRSGRTGEHSGDQFQCFVHIHSAHVQHHMIKTGPVIVLFAKDSVQIDPAFFIHVHNILCFLP